jgi:hypothetical protein
MDWLQIIGSLLAMSFGIYGLGIQPRDSSGNLTPEGRVILVGIIASGLVAILITILEIKSKAEATAMENIRFTRLFSSIERSTYSSRDGYVSFLYEIDLNAPTLREYKARLEREYENRETKCAKRNDPDDVVPCPGYEWSKSDSFEDDTLRFNLDSPLAPQENTEWVANQILRFFGVSINSYDRDYSGDWPEPTRSIQIFPEDVRSKIQLIYGQYSLGSFGLYVRIDRVPLATVNADDVGITSLYDMLGKVLVSSPVWDRHACGKSNGRERDLNCTMAVMNASIAIRSFGIDFPHGLAVNLTDTDRRKGKDSWYLVKKVPSDITKIEEVH